MRKLAAADPGNAGWQSDLVVSLYKVSTASEPPRARAVLREALAIVEALARDNRLTAASKELAAAIPRRAGEAAAGNRRTRSENSMAAYDAFVSYSHAKDKPVAAALQSVMQRLGKPWYRRRALRVFRDDTSLSATPSLWPSIEQALSNSRFLILLASPEAAASSWVNKEVSYWLDNKAPTRC